MSWPEVTFLDTGKTESMVAQRAAWGYVTEIHMPIVITQAADGTYPSNGFFDPPDAGDNLGAYDYRICNALWRISGSYKSAFNSFLRDAAKGRAQNIVMRPSAEGVFTGFYPFGVDMCDNGDYTVRLVDWEQSGKQMRPFRWFEDRISMVMVSRGGLSFSAADCSEGGLYIGSIATGFMYPPEGIGPKPEYAYSTQLSVSGAPSSINGPAAGDSWTTSFEIVCHTYHAYALIDQLVNTTRASDLSIIVPDHYDLFGADQSLDGAGGTYTAKFLGSYRDDKEIVLKIVHEGFDQFRIPLTFWMKEKTA